ILAEDAPVQQTGGINDAPRRQRLVPLMPRLTEADIADHRAFVATLGEKPIWNEFLN
ncbi:MAG: DNA polymerase III subunit epsilon, partial [Tardiphaga sp.]